MRITNDTILTLSCNAALPFNTLTFQTQHSLLEESSRVICYFNGKFLALIKCQIREDKRNILILMAKRGKQFVD